MKTFIFTLIIGFLSTFISVEANFLNKLKQTEKEVIEYCNLHNKDSSLIDFEDTKQYLISNKEIHDRFSESEEAVAQLKLGQDNSDLFLYVSGLVIVQKKIIIDSFWSMGLKYMIVLRHEVTIRYGKRSGFYMDEFISRKKELSPESWIHLFLIFSLTVLIVLIIRLKNREKRLQEQRRTKHLVSYD